MKCAFNVVMDFTQVAIVAPGIRDAIYHQVFSKVFNVMQRSFACGP